MSKGVIMLDKMYESHIAPDRSSPKEGELYQRVTTFGKTFELKYGYYEECDRQSPFCEPVVIYPDFQKEPLYTEDGTPFVTMMQDACRSFKGEEKRTSDSTCADCKHFRKGEEWFGVCLCVSNKLRE